MPRPEMSSILRNALLYLWATGQISQDAFDKEMEGQKLPKMDGFPPGELPPQRFMIAACQGEAFMKSWLIANGIPTYWTAADAWRICYQDRIQGAAGTQLSRDRDLSTAYDWQTFDLVLRVGRPPPIEARIVLGSVVYHYVGDVVSAVTFRNPKNHLLTLGQMAALAEPLLGLSTGEVLRHLEIMKWDDVPPLAAPPAAGTESLAAGTEQPRNGGDSQEPPASKHPPISLPLSTENNGLPYLTPHGEAVCAAALDIVAIECSTGDLILEADVPDGWPDEYGDYAWFTALEILGRLRLLLNRGNGTYYRRDVLISEAFRYRDKYVGQVYWSNSDLLDMARLYYIAERAGLDEVAAFDRGVSIGEKEADAAMHAARQISQVAFQTKSVLRR